MTRGALLLTLTLALTTLSGCIAYQEDDGSAGDADADPGTDTQTGPDDAHANHGATNQDKDIFTGPTAMDVLYTESWSGPKQLDEDITYDTDYDYLSYTFTNSGQQSTPVAFTTSGGEEMDESLIGNRNGVFVLNRVLPGAKGTAHVDSLTPVSGSGTLSILGMQNIPPVNLLGVVWSGQTTGLPVLGSEIGFHVPEGLGNAHITLTGSGQAAPGLRIVDADGNTVASLDATAGSGSVTAETDATPGTWALVMDGSANGSFTVTVVALPA